MGFLLLNVIFVTSNILINFIYTMKKPIFLLFILFCLLCVIPVVRAADTIFIRETQVPVLRTRRYKADRTGDPAASAEYLHVNRF